MNKPDDTTPRTSADSAARLREQFEQVLELPVETRDAWIERHVDTVHRDTLRRLLRSDAHAGPFDVSADERIGRIERESRSAFEGLIGSHVGVFRIERLLGQGGTATVFLGRRDAGDFDQAVAIKLLRRGLYSEVEQRMFQREQRALAALSHPHIAHLLDGGITPAGVPYLVIEYIDGVPITEHASSHHLDMRVRLALFVVVCEAVRAAHRALIVHRDLKPSNILVDRDGQVKLLDFGVAKLLDDDERDDLTGAGRTALTPGYAAPEQFAGGAISTATDVYALGVVLHELLTGERPRSSGAERQVSLHGDLATIVRKALSEEPERRYASARELADDVGRYLDAKPVLAHPPSTGYRLRKFVQRHRRGVIVASAAGVGLVASIALVLWQAGEAHRQAVRANTVRDVLVNVFDSARASLPRDQRPSPEVLVSQAQSQLGASAALDPETRIDLLRALAEVWLSLSKFDEVEAALMQADADAIRLGRDDLHTVIAVARADGWQRAGDSGHAMHAMEPLLSALRTDDAPLLLRALSVQAAATSAAKGPAAALPLYREAQTLASERHGERSTTALAAAIELGNALAANQQFPEAIAQLLPALDAWKTTRAPEDDRYVRGLSSLSVANDNLNNLVDAERQLREVLALKQRIYPAQHDAIANTLHDLAAVLARREDWEPAEALYREALAMQHAVLGRSHRDVASGHDSLAVLLANRRRYDEAELHYHRALAICAELQLRDEVCTRARNNLGQMYYRQDRLVDAEREMKLALAERRQLMGNDHPTIAYSLSTLSNVASKAGRYDEAVRLAQQGVDHLERIGHGTSREAIHLRNGLSQALRLAGRSEEALPLINRVLADWRRQEPNAKLRELMILVEKGTIERALQREEAVHETLAAIAHLGVPEADMSPRTRAALQQLSKPR